MVTEALRRNPWYEESAEPHSGRRWRDATCEVARRSLGDSPPVPEGEDGAPISEDSQLQEAGARDSLSGAKFLPRPECVFDDRLNQGFPRCARSPPGYLTSPTSGLYEGRGVAMGLKDFFAGVAVTLTILCRLLEAVERS